MIAQSNITTIIVGTDQDILTASETRDDLSNGQIGVFLVGSAVAKTTALAAGERFQIVYKDSGGNIIESPVIQYSNLLSKGSVSPAVAATERVRYIGFDAVNSAGSIDVANNETYSVEVRFWDTTKTYGYGKLSKFASYTSDSSATQAEIASGVSYSFNVNFQRENPKLISAEAVINNTGAAITGTGNLTAENGRNTILAATDVDAVLAVGDYIRLGTVAGAALTDGAYKITSFDTTNEIMTIDQPFQGTSGTYTEANCDYIAAATAASADAGIKVSGLPTEYNPGIIKYSKVEFENLLKAGWGTTDTSTTSVPSKGTGTYEEISEVEWFLKGNRGEPWRVGNYPKDTVLTSVAGKTYEQINFRYEDRNATTIDRQVSSYGDVFIATETESVGTPHTDLKTVLGI